MAKVKYCDKCKEKISIREMPNGVWLPFDYQTGKLHKCNEEKVKKTPKQQIIEVAIKENSQLIFHNDKHDVYIITPKKIKNKLVTGYCHLDEQIHNYTLDKMYCIKKAEPSEADMIVKGYKECNYGIEYILVSNGNKQLTKFYSKVDYNNFIHIESKQDVIVRLKEIEFLIDNLKDYVDMAKLNEYYLVNLDRNINFSLDKLLSKDIFIYLDEIKDEELINKEIILKKIDEERKKQEKEAELEEIRREENSETFKIIIGIMLAILLFYFFQ